MATLKIFSRIESANADGAAESIGSVSDAADQAVTVSFSKTVRVGPASNLTIYNADVSTGFDFMWVEPIGGDLWCQVGISNGSGGVAAERAVFIPDGHVFRLCGDASYTGHVAGAWGGGGGGAGASTNGTPRDVVTVEVGNPSAANDVWVHITVMD